MRESVRAFPGVHGIKKQHECCIAHVSQQFESKCAAIEDSYIRRKTRIVLQKPRSVYTHTIVGKNGISDSQHDSFRG